MKNSNDLISICLVWEQSRYIDVSIELSDLSKSFSSRYDFYEILLLIHENDFKKNQSEFQDIDNLRFIILKDDLDFYKKQVILAQESIGDIIVLSTIREINLFDFKELVNMSLINNDIVITKAKKISVFEKIFSYPLFFLGKLIGLRISMAMLRTNVFHRTHLNTILNQDYQDLKLRFPPSDIGFEVSSVSPSSSSYSKFSNFKSKFSLLYKLLLNLTPTLLQLLTIFSGIGMIISSGYIVYSIYIFIFMESVQPGWLTLSLSISGTALFLTSSSFILSIGIQHLLYNQKNRNLLSSSYEIDSVDLYKNIKNQLNIEINSSDEKNKQS